MNKTAELAANLHLAIRFYQEASRDSDQSRFKRLFEGLVEKKKDFARELSRVAVRKEELDSCRAKLSRIALPEVRRPASETLQLLIMCMHMEEELIRSYQTAISNGFVNPGERTKYIDQLNNSLVLFNKFKVMKGAEVLRSGN